MKKTKNNKILIDKIDTSKIYEPIEAIQILKENSYAKFEETIEVAINLGIDSNKTDQNIRGVINLPKGSGKKIKVAVLAKGEKQSEGKEAGADIVGETDLIDSISSGKIDFDIIIATPDMMPSIGKVAKILGPKGLMPNPKLGTVTNDLAAAIKNIKSGQVEYKTDKAGLIHAPIGKISFSDDELKKNIVFFLDELKKKKPENSKGVFIKKFFITSTMGPGLQVDSTSVM